MKWNCFCIEILNSPWPNCFPWFGEARELRVGAWAQVPAQVASLCTWAWGSICVACLYLCQMALLRRLWGGLEQFPQATSSSVRSVSSYRFLSLYLTDGTDRFVRWSYLPWHFFLTALLKSKSHPHRIYLVSAYSSLTFRNSELCSDNHSSVLEHSHHPQKIPHGTKF